MTLEAFNKSANTDAAPPAGLSLALQALWWDAKGDWERAHDLAQQDKGAAGAWAHAYLHRKEGDLGNAGYWYARAGRVAVSAQASLDTERDAIVAAMLDA